MLQAISTAAATSPALPDSVKDDDPPQRLTAEILPFNSKNQHEIVYFPITVDESLSAQAQALIDSSCGDSVLYLDEVPVPNKHQSKIWIGLKAAAFGIALHAVIMGLPSAELRHGAPYSRTVPRRLITDMMNISGIWVPLVTPFTDGEVDYKAAQKLAAHLVDQGVHGLVVCGTTGEAHSLNMVEKTLLQEAVVDSVRGRCPVLMGLSGSNTREVASDAWAFEQTGIDGYLLSAPCYVHPSQAGIIEHFRHIAKVTDLPIIIYNIPSRTGVNIEPETIATLCESEQFVAVKECGGLPALMKLKDAAPCRILCGDDSLLLATLKLGGYGAISASAHIRPDLFVRMYELAHNQQFEETREIFCRLLPLINLLFSEPNPAPVKAALAMQGWINDELRLPMLPASDACKAQLRQALNDLDTSKPIYHMNGAKAYAA